jgi:hypothetical protein
MHRVNIILNDSAWAALQEIPRGERSKVVSSAIEKMASLTAKVKAAKKMDILRQKLSKVSSTTEISNWIREDRRR